MGFFFFIGRLNGLWAQSPTLEAQYDMLPKHHELLNPVLSSTRSDVFKNGVKSRVGACLLIHILSLRHSAPICILFPLGCRNFNAIFG